MKSRKGFARASVCLIWFFAAVGCGNRADNPDVGLSSETLGAAALSTYARYVKMHRDDVPQSEEVPASCWAREIRALHPLKIYLHRANLVVVQKESAGVEEGKYIYLVISSYLPQSGDDGFTFANRDGSVSDFRRVKP